MNVFEEIKSTTTDHKISRSSSCSSSCSLLVLCMNFEIVFIIVKGLILGLSIYVYVYGIDDDWLRTYVFVRYFSVRLFLRLIDIWLCWVQTVELLHNRVLYIMHPKSPPGIRKKKRYVSTWLKLRNLEKDNKIDLKCR